METLEMEVWREGRLVETYTRSYKEVLEEIVFYQNNYGRKISVKEKYIDGKKYVDLITRYVDGNKYIYKNVKYH